MTEQKNAATTAATETAALVRRSFRPNSPVRTAASRGSPKMTQGRLSFIARSQFQRGQILDMRGLPPGFLDQLLTEWSAVTDPLVIVLDDIHHLRSPEITEGLGFVVEHLPGARECS